MYAMILAAGRGERMRPLTDHIPKPLLQVGSKSLIEYHLHRFAQAGFAHVVINHAWLGEQVVTQLGDGKRYGLQIHYSAEESALDTGGGIFQALPLLGQQPFVVVNADVWSDYPFERFYQYQNLTNLAHLILVDNPPQHPQGDFSLTTSGHVALDGQPMLTFSGMGVYHPRLFTDCQVGKFSIVPLLRQAMQQQQVSAEYYQGVWRDVGTPQRLEQLRQQVSEDSDERSE